MDIIDHAQALDEMFREQSLSTYKKSREAYEYAAQIEKFCIRDGVHYCRDCCDEIPPGRIEANPFAVRCVDCQEKKERK